MLRHWIVSCIALTVTLAFVGSVDGAATLIVEFDANNVAPGGGPIPDSAPNSPTGGPISPTAGIPQNLPGRGITTSDYGAPVFFASGAGYQQRAYYDFQKFGLLHGSNVGSSDFGPGVNGYTLEGYFRIQSDASVIENSGLGFGQDSNGENQTIRLPNAGGSPSGVQNPVTLLSNSATDNSLGGPQSLNQVDVNINSIIPRNQWFHFIKVHDPVAEQVRFYIDGGPADLTVSFPENGVEYHAFNENYGNVGDNTREVRGVQYSLTRFYSGVMSDADINIRYLTVVPEPGSAMLLTMAGAVLLGRRSRRAS
jgi:hypothetical protein